MSELRYRLAEEASRGGHDLFSGCEDKILERAHQGPEQYYAMTGFGAPSRCHPDTCDEYPLLRQGALATIPSAHVAAEFELPDPARSCPRLSSLIIKACILLVHRI